MFCIVPFMLVFSFFAKNYGLRSEIIILCWQFGTVVGIGLWGWKTNTFNSQQMQLLLPMLIVFALGVILGTPGNVLLSQAVPISPNPALPFTIINAASALVYILAIFLAFVLPRHFKAAHFTWSHFVGIMLVITGLSLMMYKNT